MLKRIIIGVALCCFVLGISAQEIVHKTLPNGMELITKENNGNGAVGYFCFVKTGSETEGDYLGAGISHYLEHLVSSGTTTLRSEDEYEALGKDMGAIVNAYTTSVVTCFHIIVDKQYKDQAREILSEQIQYCVIDSFEAAREREVILKEIVFRSTPPRAKVMQRHNELVYPNSNKKYPVIGYTELYETITQQELTDYYHKRYSPNNMIFVVVGDVDPQEEMDKLVTTFKDFPREQLNPVYLPVQNRRNGELEYIEEFKIEQPMCYLSTILPADEYVDGPALNAAMEILFAKRKSPIRQKLVEELQLVNYVYGYCSDSPSSPEGEILIGFEAKDPAKVKDITAIIDAELEHWVETGFTQEQLNRVVNRMEAQELLSTPGVESECNSIGWSMVLNGVPDYSDAELAVYKSLTPEDLTQAIKKHLLPKNRVVFYAMPQGTSTTLENPDALASQKADVEKINVSKNLTLLYRQNTEKPLVSGIINFPVTENYETTKTAGLVNFMLDIMLSGSKKYQAQDVSEWLEDHAATYSIWADQYGTNIQFKCSKSDFATLQKMLFDALENPTFDQKEIDLAKSRRTASYKRSLSRAESRHADFTKSVLYQGSRESLSDDALLDIIINTSRQDLMNLYDELFRTKAAIVTLFGDVSQDEAEDFAKDVFDQFSHKTIEVPFTPRMNPITTGTFTNPYGFEQVNINLFYNAPTSDSEDFWAFQVMQQILNGARGRIHQIVRGENDLAYFAFAEYDYGPENGFFKLTSQTSGDKKDELLMVLKNEMVKISSEQVTTEELNSAIDEQYKMIRSYMNDNVMPYYVTHYEAMGFGYDFMNTSLEAYRTVTPEDILRVAKKYLTTCSVVVSVPDETVDLMVK